MISVIVPMYNAEKSIEKCVSSIQKSTYKDLEIILINDGSIDRTLEICNYLKETDDRIIIIDKENTGAGLSRQAGVEKAKGKYLAFVDSDDWIDKELYSIVYNKLEEKKLDACFFGYQRHNVDGTSMKVEVKFPKEIYCEEEIKSKLLHNCVWFSKNDDESPISTVWMGIYKREVITKNNIQFYSEREYYSEDSIYNLEVLSKCKRVGFENICKYHFIRTGKSLSAVLDDGRYDKFDNWYQLILNISKGTNIEQYILGYLDNMYMSLYKGSLDQIIEKHAENKEVQKLITEHRKKTKYLSKIRIRHIVECSFKRKITFYIIKYCTRMYYFMKKI